MAGVSSHRHVSGQRQQADGESFLQGSWSGRLLSSASHSGRARALTCSPGWGLWAWRPPGLIGRLGLVPAGEDGGGGTRQGVLSPWRPPRPAACGMHLRQQATRGKLRPQRPGSCCPAALKGTGSAWARAWKSWPNADGDWHLRRFQGRCGFWGATTQVPGPGSFCFKGRGNISWSLFGRPASSGLCAPRLVGVRGAEPAVPGPGARARRGPRARAGPRLSDSLRAGLLCGLRAPGPLLSWAVTGIMTGIRAPRAINRLLN